jgi:deferrochelatase/peroxidase EfeB
VLGYLQDCGADPWVAGPGLQIWPDKVRAFFRNGSFGVLQQIEQDVSAFERFVEEKAKETQLSPGMIKGKLCGRYPNGRPLAAGDGVDPRMDFDYSADPKGHRCPFGSHARRMNPRLPRTNAVDGENPMDPPDAGDRPAHFGRARPLLRRGMPYGPPWVSEEKEKANPQQRGLIGQFFCASIEDQYEHLLGEWAERVPLGSPDEGGARDPLFGAHEPSDGPFDIPRPPGQPVLRLKGLTAFTRTIGVAYLFYPSLTTVACIADSSMWGLENEVDGEDDDE